MRVSLSSALMASALLFSNYKLPDAKSEEPPKDSNVVQSEVLAGRPFSGGFRQQYYQPQQFARQYESQIISQGLNKYNVPQYQITDDIVIEKSSESVKVDPKYKDIEAYYKVDLPVSLHLVKYKNGKFGVSSNRDDWDSGKLFTKTNNIHFSPVATVSAKFLKKTGGFEIYYVGESGSNYPEYSGYGIFSVKYNPFLLPPNLSNLIEIPGGSNVNPQYAENMSAVLAGLPPGINKALSDNGFKMVIGEGIDDTYYRYYPSWRNDDLSKNVDPSKPAIEESQGKDPKPPKDNRLNKHKRGLFVIGDNRAIMPQKWFKYPSNTEVIDRSDNMDETREVAYHEIGHQIDKLGGYSNKPDFTAVYEQDLKDLKIEDKGKITYFVNQKGEAFAEIYAALTKGLSSKDSKRILKAFPRTAEYIRTSVLPIYGYRITEDEVKAQIYPEYLEFEEKNNETEDKEKIAVSVSDLSRRLCYVSNSIS